MSPHELCGSVFFLVTTRIVWKCIFVTTRIVWKCIFVTTRIVWKCIFVTTRIVWKCILSRSRFSITNRLPTELHLVSFWPQTAFKPWQLPLVIQHTFVSLTHSLIAAVVQRVKLFTPWSLSSEFFVRLFIGQLSKTEVLIASAAGVWTHFTNQIAFSCLTLSHLGRDTLWHLRLDLFRGSD